MFDGMKDIAHQLVLKWARFGPEEEINVTEDFSNLTLDTIALCTMDWRFNSFYRDGLHPYVAAMMNQLNRASQRQSQIPVISQALSLLSLGCSKQDDGADDAAFMAKTTMEIITNRRSNPTKKQDFLNSLLFGVDPKTGEKMRDKLIASQMQTFLIAGHETTSGLLSFAIMFLLQHPETYRKAQEEVDRIVGTGSVDVKHLKNLHYVDAVLKETLRLVPTAPAVTKIVHPNAQGQLVTLGGKYKIENTDRVRLLLGRCMTDPKIFGDDARDFKPDRMLPSDPNFELIEQYWRPFSQGNRACLGRPFSLQEGQLALTLILQNFDLRLSDPMYEMHIKQNLTIKPTGLYVKASLRDGMSSTDLAERLHSDECEHKSKKFSKGVETQLSESVQNGSPITILYGSNTGTCQSLAQNLGSICAASLGLNPQVADMDANGTRLSKKHPVVVITASYEGQPPDNAMQFIEWLQGLKGSELEGVKFAVFGCGNREWHSTFHRVPKLVDELMAAHGAHRIAQLGVSDVSQGNPMADFEQWLDQTLMPSLQTIVPQSDRERSSLPSIEAEISTGERVATLRHDLQVGTVRDVQRLTDPGEKTEKRHIEISLPSESHYECGDYLAILPQSPEPNVRAVMAHFKLPTDATITLKSQAFAPLPLNTKFSVSDLLRNYYELAKPTTRRGLTVCLQHTQDAKAQEYIGELLQDSSKFQTEVTDSKLSLFALLQYYPAINLAFQQFLSLLPPLSIRQYSISSSPLRDPEVCTLTYSIIADKKDAERPFYGVATTYLSSLKPGDRIQVATRRTAKQAFRLPLDAERTPMLMFAAGTGLAPFRGFIEQRAIQLEANRGAKLAPAHLFLGCRSATKDRLYARQMDDWAEKGAVTLHYAFSREPEKSNGCKHVSDRMLLEESLIAEAWMNDARAYTCGNRAFAEDVGRAAREIINKRVTESRVKQGLSDEEVERRKTEIMSSFKERAADDVFD